MGQFTADIAALTKAAQDIAVARRNLVEEKSQVSAVVTDLLNSGWEGNAKTAYQAGWNDWLADADKVLAALDKMAGAIHATLADYREQDRQASAGLLASGQSLMAPTTDQPGSLLNLDSYSR